jgi:hypothetical protein
MSQGVPAELTLASVPVASEPPVPVPVVAPVAPDPPLPLADASGQHELSDEKCQQDATTAPRDTARDTDKTKRISFIANLQL